MKNTILLLALTGSLGAQVPTGAIAGVVRDPSGAGAGNIGRHMPANWDYNQPAPTADEKSYLRSLRVSPEVPPVALIVL